MKLNNSFIAVALISIMYLFATSCEKKTDCTAVITCRDSTDAPMVGANVFLYANVKTPQGGTITADIRANAKTDESGKVSFIFKLPAIYDIKASGTVGGKTLNGTSIIKLEEGKTIDKTVVCR